MSSRPSTSHGLSTSNVPLIRSFRFSSSHDVHNGSSSNGTATSSGKRASRLQEYLGRSRTASLPPRPHTSTGTNGANQHTAVGNKYTDPAEDSSLDSTASSSLASGEYDRPLRAAPLVTLHCFFSIAHIPADIVRYF